MTTNTTKIAGEDMTDALPQSFIDALDQYGGAESNNATNIGRGGPGLHEHVEKRYTAVLDAARALLASKAAVPPKTDNPHRGGTAAYLATEHYNEGWNACLAAIAGAPDEVTFVSKWRDVIASYPSPDMSLATAPAQSCEQAEKAVYREVGVWETNGSKFKTYSQENLNGKAMYVRDSK